MNSSATTRRFKKVFVYDVRFTQAWRTAAIYGDGDWERFTNLWSDYLGLL